MTAPTRYKMLIITASTLVVLFGASLILVRSCENPSQAMLRVSGSPSAVIVGEGAGPSHMDPVTGETPIRFYGITVDENERPVPGVNIKFQIRRASHRPPRPFEIPLYVDGSAVSDAAGCFNVEARGFSIDFQDFTKPGYSKAAHTERGYHYGLGAPPFTPDAGRRERFILVNMSNPQKVSYSECRLAADWTGGAVRVDLKTGRPSRTGELEITCHRGDHKKRPFAWDIALQLKRGGLLEHRGRPPLMAPVSGYQSEWKFSMPGTTQTWQSIADATIYWHQESVYGRIQMRFYSDREERAACIVLDLYRNDSGGRITAAESYQ